MTHDPEIPNLSVAELKRDWEEYCKNGGKSNRVLVRDYKQKFGEIFASALKKGMPEPDQIPHPAHIDYDADKRCFILTGPKNVQEKTLWESLKQQIRINEAIIKRIVSTLKKHPGDQDKLERLRQAEFVIACLQKKTPVGWNCHERLGWEKSKDQTKKI